jgi:VanZ family protein
VPGLLLLVIAVVLYGSLYPWDFNFHTPVSGLWMVLHNWPTGLTRWVILDVILNVLLYVPVGALAFLTFARRRRSTAVALLLAVVLGFAMSVTVEMLQAYDRGRDAGGLDVITNTTGALTGALLALLFQPAIESLAARGTRRSATAAAVLAVLWGAFQLYPFVPLFRIARLYAGLAFLKQPPVFAPVELWSATAEWFTISLLLEFAAEPLDTVWPAFLMLVIPLRLFIPGRGVGWNDLFGAGLALLLWCGMRPKRRLGAGAWIMGSAILAYELAPFHFLAHPQHFSWIPFFATLGSERQTAAVIVLRKAFEYGALVWLLHARGWSYLRSGALLAAALLGLELVQRYLPGRTPESTDAVLAALMALVLWLASDFRPGWH